MHLNFGKYINPLITFNTGDSSDIHVQHVHIIIIYLCMFLSAWQDDINANEFSYYNMSSSPIQSELCFYFRGRF